MVDEQGEMVSRRSRGANEELEALHFQARITHPIDIAPGLITTTYIPVHPKFFQLPCPRTLTDSGDAEVFRPSRWCDINSSASQWEWEGCHCWLYWDSTCKARFPSPNVLSSEYKPLN